jgi:hypothetical protein
MEFVGGIMWMKWLTYGALKGRDNVSGSATKNFELER